MDEATVRLLEDRVLRAIERLRALREECEGLAAQLEQERARLSRVESETWARAARAAETVWSERVAAAAEVLREAIRQLREEASPSGSGEPGATGRGEPR